jgi:hypothetical protein
MIAVVYNRRSLFFTLIYLSALSIVGQFSSDYLNPTTVKQDEKEETAKTRLLLKHLA